jgi:hypothetical protein
MVRIRMASASISRRLTTVSGSIWDSFNRRSWVSARRADKGFDRSCRSLLSRSESLIEAYVDEIAERSEKRIASTWMAVR